MRIVTLLLLSKKVDLNGIYGVNGESRTIGWTGDVVRFGLVDHAVRPSVFSGCYCHVHPNRKVQDVQGSDTFNASEFSR